MNVRVSAAALSPVLFGILINSLVYTARPRAAYAAHVHERGAQHGGAHGGGPGLPQSAVIAPLLLLPPVKELGHGSEQTAVRGYTFFGTLGLTTRNCSIDGQPPGNIDTRLQPPLVETRKVSKCPVKSVVLPVKKEKKKEKEEEEEEEEEKSRRRGEGGRWMCGTSLPLCRGRVTALQRTM